VRELENIIERAVIVCQGEELTAENLPEHFVGHPVEAKASADGLIATTLDELEKQHIARVLEYTNGNISRAAQILGIQRNTIKSKIRQYQLD
jgi:DNA-binding NtrC family response regulator